MVFGRKKLEKKVAEQVQQQVQQQLQAQEEAHRREKREWEDAERERHRIENLQREVLQREERARQLQERQRVERERRRLERLRLTSPEALRGLRDLVRTRYQLDMEIWSLKGVRGPDRPLIVEKMEKSDAILMEIYTMVETWEGNANTWTPEEWKLAIQIKERILGGGQRWWENNPPWNEA